MGMLEYCLSKNQDRQVRASHLICRISRAGLAFRSSIGDVIILRGELAVYSPTRGQVHAGGASLLKQRPSQVFTHTSFVTLLIHCMSGL